MSPTSYGIEQATLLTVKTSSKEVLIQRYLRTLCYAKAHVSIDPTMQCSNRTEFACATKTARYDSMTTSSNKMGA